MNAIITGKLLRNCCPTTENNQFYIDQIPQWGLYKPHLHNAVFQLRVRNQKGLRQWIDLLDEYTKRRSVSRKRDKRLDKPHDWLCIPLSIWTGKEIKHGKVQVDFPANKECLQVFQELVERFTGYRGFYLQIHNALNLTSVEVAFDIYPMSMPVDEDDNEVPCLELKNKLAYRLLPKRQSNLCETIKTGQHQPKTGFMNGISTSYVDACHRKDRDLPLEEISFNPAASLLSKTYAKFVWDCGWFVRLEATIAKGKRKRLLPLDWRDFGKLADAVQKIKIEDFWYFAEIDFPRFAQDFAKTIAQDAQLQLEVKAAQAGSVAIQKRVMGKVLRRAGQYRQSEHMKPYMRFMSLAEAIAEPLPDCAGDDYRVDVSKTRLAVREAIKQKIRITRPA